MVSRLNSTSQILYISTTKLRRFSGKSKHLERLAIFNLKPAVMHGGVLIIRRLKKTKKSMPKRIQDVLGLRALETQLEVTSTMIESLWAANFYHSAFGLT